MLQIDCADETFRGTSRERKERFVTIFPAVREELEARILRRLFGNRDWLLCSATQPVMPCPTRSFKPVNRVGYERSWKRGGRGSSPSST